MMIEIKEKKNCCGCAACVNICPKNCITMNTDFEGFEYPVVDKTICIDCHACEKICPEIHTKPEIISNQKAFLLQIKNDKIRYESASGGAFTAIASWVIHQKGIVFGVAMDVNNLSIKHKWVDNENDLSLFRNSKYVQSRIGNTFNQVKKFLKQDRWVCFSGTPCQIEGLVSFLRKPYDKLVLIDVVCYGIPSPGFFKNYIAWQQDKIGGRITKFLFREKRHSYNYTSVSIYNEDETKNYHSGVERDKFMRSFFSNRNVRPSCYKCKFKKRYRVSDFTIWDCYDVKKFSKNFDENGTNRLLVHTNKAMMIINELENSVRLEEYFDIEKFIKDETAMTKSVPMPEDRTEFFNDYASKPFDIFINTWFADTWKIKLNSWLRMTAFKLGIYNKAKQTVKALLHKNLHE